MSNGLQLTALYDEALFYSLDAVAEVIMRRVTAPELSGTGDVGQFLVSLSVFWFHFRFSFSFPFLSRPLIEMYSKFVVRLIEIISTTAYNFLYFKHNLVFSCY